MSDVHPELRKVRIIAELLVGDVPSDSRDWTIRGHLYEGVPWEVTIDGIDITDRVKSVIMDLRRGTEEDLWAFLVMRAA